MSSFELLEAFGASVVDDEDETRTVYAEFAPEDGALAAAYRGGARPEWKQALVQCANVAAITRASKFSKVDGSTYGEQMFMPVSTISDEDRAAIARGEVIRFPGEYEEG